MDDKKTILDLFPGMFQYKPNDVTEFYAEFRFISVSPLFVTWLSDGRLRVRDYHDDWTLFIRSDEIIPHGTLNWVSSDVMCPHLYPKLFERNIEVISSEDTTYIYRKWCIDKIIGEEY
jgi:hypothetical protein